MPYDTRSDLPDSVRDLPEKAQDIWRKAFNNAYQSWKPSMGKKKGMAKSREEYAFRVAWSAVKDWVD